MNSKDALYKELKAKTKRANQRIVRLESRGENTPALKIAKNDITNILQNKNTKGRFLARKSMTYAEMEKQLKYTNKFLNSVSSTVTGMKNTLSKRAKTLQKRFGVSSGKISDIYRIFESEAFKKASELLPSSMVVQAVSESLDSDIPSSDIIKVLEDLQKTENDVYLYDRLTELLDELI